MVANEQVTSKDLILIEPHQSLARVQSQQKTIELMHDEVLKLNQDYGVIPGTGKKPTLLKPGAEKLCSAFGLNPVFEIIDKTENWDDDGAFFNYEYRCRLVHIDTGKEIATGDGGCNSKEKKYRYRWVKEAEAVRLGIDVATAPKNKWGKVQAPNTEIFDQVNTLMKMAQKRALVAAVLIGTGASQFFTQDLEDMGTYSTANDTHWGEDTDSQRTVVQWMEMNDVTRDQVLAELEPGRDLRGFTQTALTLPLTLLRISEIAAALKDAPSSTEDSQDAPEQAESSPDAQNGAETPETANSGNDDAVPEWITDTLISDLFHLHEFNVVYDDEAQVKSDVALLALERKVSKTSQPKTVAKQLNNLIDRRVAGEVVE